MNLGEQGRHWRDRFCQIDPAHSSAAAEVAAVMDAWLRELSQLAPFGKENQLHSSETWKATQDLLSRGWLQHRARTKPRGYAGDYELFRRICDQEVCEDPWGRLFDLYFQSQAAPRAVRARTQYVANAIVEAVRGSNDVQRIVSVGSGPARDIRFACQELAPEQHQRLEVFLLDIDPEALEFAASDLEEFLDPQQLHLERINLFRLPKLKSLHDRLANAALIACTGLFDYLEDSDIVAMLECFHRCLAMGGRGIVFHMSPHNPTRAYMEWIANWYLEYRTLAALVALGRTAGLPATATTVSLIDGLAVGLDWQKVA